MPVVLLQSTSSVISRPADPTADERAHKADKGDRDAESAVIDHAGRLQHDPATKPTTSGADDALDLRPPLARSMTFGDSPLLVYMPRPVTLQVSDGASSNPRSGLPHRMCVRHGATRSGL